MLDRQITGSGPDVLLLHGVGLSKSMWDRCVPLLDGYRVTAVDLPGHGNSSPVSEGVSLAELAEEVLDAIPRGPVHIVGFSLGAMVAQQLALHPSVDTATLALVSAVALRSTMERETVQQRLEETRKDFHGVALEALGRWFSPQWRSRDPHMYELIKRTMLANDVDSYAACYEVFARSDAELWPQTGAIACPVLAVTGEQDPRSNPRQASALADHVQDGRARIIPDSRHLLPLEQPEELVRALRDNFVRSTPGV